MMEGVAHESQAEPMPERIAGIASSARAWLATLVEDIPAHGSTAVRASCYVLISSWIADAIAGSAGSNSAGFLKVAQYVSRSLNASENWNYIVSVNPTLRLLVEVLLSSEGLTVEPFRQFLTQSVSILRRRDPALEADVSLMDKRILLHGAGVLPRPPTLPSDGVRVLSGNFPLSASAEEVDALILQLECLTGWGTRLVDAEVIEPTVGEMLAGFAVQRLRKYDLISATRLLRLLEYLAASRVIVRRDDLYSFLCAHHRAHGPFGWYGPEAAELRKLSPASLEDIEFYLPTTLECLWTLAERWVDGWRLFDKVPSYVLPET